jgi:uncharacterized protein (DUF1501 family)
MTTPNAFTRREFLGSGLVLASTAIAAPSFLQSSAKAMAAAMAGVSSVAGVPDDHVLVVVQLSGGNDGLNTVVPYGMAEYHRARPGIGVKENEALKLSGPNADGIGLHPQMAPFKELYDEGLASVIQGVGYPNPNRSHFKSMDIWHTADTTATGDGWLGKYFDSECCGFGKGESGTNEARRSAKAAAAKATPAPGAPTGGTPGIAIGRTAPLAMQGRRAQSISFESEELFRWSAEDIHPSLKEGYQQLASREVAAASDAESNAAFLMRTALDAQVSSELIRKAVRRRPDVAYPNTEIGRQMQMIASMIAAGLKTRVYYASLGGFDTHAQQGGANGRHGQLLNQLAQALRAFHNDLKRTEHADRVLTMSFSEFGRRVGQNASQGTDHGTAAPMFLMGSMVRPGVIGEHPSMKDLDDGDLKYRIDFRSVYAGILEGWLGTNQAANKQILDGTYKALSVIRGA